MAKLTQSSFHLPYNRELVERAKDLRKNMTVAEKKLWLGYLKKFKFRVLRQRPIDHFIVDFYCAALKLVIEVDGDRHSMLDGLVYDKERTRILKEYGLSVIRFHNQEVLNDFDSVCQKIENWAKPK